MDIFGKFCLFIFFSFEAFLLRVLYYITCLFAGIIILVMFVYQVATLVSFKLVHMFVYCFTFN